MTNILQQIETSITANLGRAITWTRIFTQYKTRDDSNSHVVVAIYLHKKYNYNQIILKYISNFT